MVNTLAYYKTTNIGIGLKVIPVANAVAYFASASVMTLICHWTSFIALPPGANVLKIPQKFTLVPPFPRVKILWYFGQCYENTMVI